MLRLPYHQARPRPPTIGLMKADDTWEQTASPRWSATNLLGNCHDLKHQQGPRGRWGAAVYTVP